MVEESDLIGDGTQTCSLPTIPGKHSDLKSITNQTVRCQILSYRNNQVKVFYFIITNLRNFSGSQSLSDAFLINIKVVHLNIAGCWCNFREVWRLHRQRFDCGLQIPVWIWWRSCTCKCSIWKYHKNPQCNNCAYLNYFHFIWQSVGFWLCFVLFCFFVFF